MKKFIFTTNVIAILFLVPAVLVGYLNTNNDAPTQKASGDIVAKQTKPTVDFGNIVRLVKTF